MQPAQDSSPDGQPMEVTAYLEHSALGVSLDSGLMEGMLCTEPLDRSVFGALSVVRPEETGTPEASGSGITDNSTNRHVLHCRRGRCRIIHNTDVSTDINTDLPENSAPYDYLGLELAQMEYTAVFGRHRIPRVVDPWKG